jgi:hypothetical protein
MPPPGTWRWLLAAAAVEGAREAIERTAMVGITRENRIQRQRSEEMREKRSKVKSERKGMATMDRTPWAGHKSFSHKGREDGRRAEVIEVTRH